MWLPSKQLLCCSTLKSGTWTFISRGSYLYDYQGNGRRSGIEQSRSTKRAFGSSRGARESSQSRRGWWQRMACGPEGKSDICRAGLVTRMGRSHFLSSLLVGLIFKCMLLTKLFWTTSHHFYHFQLPVYSNTTVSVSPSASFIFTP